MESFHFINSLLIFLQNHFILSIPCLWFQSFDVTDLFHFINSLSMISIIWCFWSISFHQFLVYDFSHWMLLIYFILFIPFPCIDSSTAGNVVRCSVCAASPKIFLFLVTPRAGPFRSVDPATRKSDIHPPWSSPPKWQIPRPVDDGAERETNREHYLLCRSFYL